MTAKDDGSDGSISEWERRSIRTQMQPGTTNEAEMAISQRRLLSTLESLLAIDGASLRAALDEATNLIVKAINAEKADAFLYEASSESLVAVGTSDTPLGRRQHKIGMNRLPLANDGREIDVFKTGTVYHTGHADKDPEVLMGMKDGLAVRSLIITPLDVNGERRGVVQVCSRKEDAFTEEDVIFMSAVSNWVGAVAYRVELTKHVAEAAALQARQVVAEELITIMAHDLNNYIMPLMGRLSMITARAKRQDRPRDVEDAEAASRSIRRITHLTEDLMDSARLDQGILALSPQPLDLVALVQDTLSVLETSRLDTILNAPEELRIAADPKRIKQIVENLVANALKHSPEGVPVEVTVDRHVRDDIEWATVEVVDQGPGIPPELMPRLFTRFASGPGSTGLGLGLYLGRSIAEAHGGTLTVTSKPGQGTRFCLSIPTL